ncbi:hypothetical protein CMO93_02475 [Candidatus Woesearchaeota archaeon]|nr:hypothetical protein [Candidatus Woesearchaeota archaeon]|tara:strand:- start:7404 stop:8270 length:867 start_codon:yes stop_codon:yes gene_type:complete
MVEEVLGNSPEPGFSALEIAISEYDGLDTLCFDTLQKWELELHNPFDLLQLYGHISFDALLSEEGAPHKEFERGLLGYLKGQHMNARRNAEQLTTTDELTKLPNNRGYELGLKRCLGRAERDQYADHDKSIAVIFVDINNFKSEANDKYKHEFGDDILTYVADALKEYSRTTDLQARISGDEFILVLDPLETKKAREVLKKLTANIDSYIQKRISLEHPGKKSAVTVSLGMSIYGQDAQSEKDLRSHADEAMYHAKRNPTMIKGKPLHFHIYDPRKKYVAVDKRKGRG